MAQRFWLCLFCLMNSCASVRTTGSFVEHPAPNSMRTIALDAAHQLGLLYPPAHAQLSIARSTDDDFGKPLITELRSLGFAVAEPAARGSQLAMTYVLDEVEPLYRVVVRVTSAHRRISLTRAYTFRGDGLRAAGAWTQQTQQDVP